MSIQRYAVDIALLSENKEGFEEMLNTVGQVLESCEMEINKSKTKIVICGGRKQTKIGNRQDNYWKKLEYLVIPIANLQEL